MPQGKLLSRLASALTLNRIRAHGLVLAICMWSLYLADVSTPGMRDRFGLIKGTDFVHFYTLGSVALQHRGAELYDAQAQTAMAEKLVPEAQGLHYVALYGPQVSLFFAPFARLSYGFALALWWLISGALYGVCCYAIWRLCPNLQPYGSVVLIVAIAYPAFLHLIAWGQTSAPGLLCVTVAFLALRSNRRLLAGLAIGLLAFKPSLGLAAAFVFVFAGEWKVVAGAITSGAIQLAAAWIYYGTSVMRSYANALRHVPDIFPYLEPRPYAVHSLRAFWSLLVPWPWPAFVLYVLTSVIALAIAVRLWRSGAPLSLRYSALLTATVLVSPHLTVYDLVVVAPAFLLLSDWTVAHPEHHGSPVVGVLLYLCYALPLFGFFSQWTHLQLSVAAFAGLLWCLWHIAMAPESAAAAGRQGLAR